MKAKLFISITGLLILCACTISHHNDIKKTEWLIGTWENKTTKGSIYETWNKKNDHEFSGKSYIIQEKDTIVFENIQIVQDKKKLFYIPTVKNQNGGLPIRFSAKMISDNKLIFENPVHDFPQVISYTKTGENMLIAEISGTKNGQKRNQIFPMKRIK